MNKYLLAINKASTALEIGQLGELELGRVMRVWRRLEKKKPRGVYELGVFEKLGVASSRWEEVIQGTSEATRTKKCG